MANVIRRNLVDIILARRSVREGFVGTPVARDELEAIVECGLSAPSSKNAQPWRLHVVRDSSLLLSIAEAVRNADGASSYVPHDPRTGVPYPNYVSTVTESADILQQVSSAIFVENRGVFSGGRQQLCQAGVDALRSSITGYGLELVGLGAAVENMWLAANALGLAAAFIGDIAVAEDEIKVLLDISGDLVGALALGHAPLDTSVRTTLARDHLVVWH